MNEIKLNVSVRLDFLQKSKLKHNKGDKWFVFLFSLLMYGFAFYIILKAIMENAK